MLGIDAVIYFLVFQFEVPGLKELLVPYQECRDEDQGKGDAKQDYCDD